MKLAIWEMFDYHTYMKKLLYRFMASVFALWCFSISSFVFSNNSFQLIPEADNETAADAVSKALLEVKPEESFRDVYNSGAKRLENDLGAQIRAWVFSRNSILQIGVYILRFVMQLALVVGSAMLIRSWYTYALVALWAREKPEEASKAIKNALIWLFIISISYTLIRLLQMAFLS